MSDDDYSEPVTLTAMITTTANNDSNNSNMLARIT